MADPTKKCLKANFDARTLRQGTYLGRLLLIKAHLFGNVQRDCFRPEQPQDLPLQEGKVEDEEAARGLYCRPAEKVDRGRQVKSKCERLPRLPSGK